MNGDTLALSNIQPLQGIPGQDQPSSDQLSTELQYPSPEQQAGPSEQDLADLRAQHATELEDPRVLGDLFNLTRNEVGGQGPEARQAFMESVMNRAIARRQSLTQAVNDRHYYPGISYRSSSMSPNDMANYSDSLMNVLGGSNISNYATGNASGRVGFNRGVHTASFGGERFGVEGPDMGWHKRAGGDQGGMETALAPSRDPQQNAQAAMMASSYTGKPLEQVDTSDLNAILQGQITGRSRGLMAGDQPTEASVEQSNALLQAGQNQSEGTADLEAKEGPATGLSDDVTTGDIPSPSTKGMKMTPKPDGTFVFNEGSPNEIQYNPVTHMKKWHLDDTYDMFQIGDYGPTQKIKRHDYHTNLATGLIYDYNKPDANGAPSLVPGQKAKIDPTVWKSIIDARAPTGVKMPDGSTRPFASTEEAMDSLNQFERAQQIPTKYQSHVIDLVTRTINSGRNPFVRAYTQQAPSYASAVENIHRGQRNGLDDAMLLASYYGIERPGLAPTELDFKNFVNAQGILGKLRVKGKQFEALIRAGTDKINGKEPSADDQVTLNQGRLIDDSVLPQMERAMQGSVRTRWELYKKGIAPLRAQLEGSGIANPDRYLPDIKPDFIQDEEDAAALKSGRAPAVPGATPARGAPPPTNDQAFPLIQKALNSDDPNMRALGQQAMEEYQRRTQAATPTPTPTP